MNWQVAAVLGIIAVLSGCIPFTGIDGQSLELNRDEGGFYLSAPGTSAETTNGFRMVEKNMTLVAEVFGSIYEGGETVSVFGTCLTQDDEPYPSSYALLSAWYPNGTVLFTDTTMQEIRPAYFLYTAPMDVVGGTYLTQMECKVNNTDLSSLTFGEWQNPAWVNRIGDTQTQVQNLTVQIGDVAYQIEDGFNLTFDRIENVNDSLSVSINESFVNLSQQITRTGEIANGSVDRNNSYLASLLVSLQNQLTPGVVNNTLVWDEDADNVVYNSEWDIRVDVFDADKNNKRVVYPDVLCSINTTQTSSTSMQPQGNHFTYSEFIDIPGGSEFNWDVECDWV